MSFNAKKALINQSNVLIFEIRIAHFFLLSQNAGDISVTIIVKREKGKALINCGLFLESIIGPLSRLEG